jgi:hypothetical protein
VTRRLASLRDRPVAEDERRAAVVAVLAFLLAAALVLGVTHRASRAPALRPALTHTATANIAHPPLATTRSALEVARGFLSGYLAYAYGRTPAAAVPDAGPALIGSLEHHPPRVTVARQARLPRIGQLDVTLAQSGQPVVNAVLNDGGIVNYTVSLLLAGRRGRLLVTALEPAR